ncbi:MAG TPA: oxygenase MpaB family protein, partial [Candidatus Limnocylindrales bacterium]|nr:oxygenase MpaB family protein [Candidatus Limnocylindrales bacterium]
LTRDRRARFYAETRPIGRAFGIPDDLLPADLDGFDRYVADMLAPSGPIHPTQTARDLAAAILAPPLGPVVPALGWLPPPLYAWALWPAIGLLPGPLRDEYGLRWGARERLVSAWLVAAWRAWRPILPRSFRSMPQASAADRRVGALRRR